MTIERAIDIVLIVTLFMIVAYALILMFGGPTCAAMANETSVKLKFAIDMVADDSFPFYREYGVPTDPAYYKTVPIRLCQEKVTGIEAGPIKIPGYAYWLQFFGGIPEYQIYYEQFPEPGWMWNEAYPWSGGAANTFVFWGVMRGVTWITPRLTKGWYLYKTVKKVGLLNKVKGVFMDGRASFFEVLTHTSKYEEFIKEAIEPFLAKRGAAILGEFIAEQDAHEILKALAKAGFIKEVGGQFYGVGDKLVLSNVPVPMTAMLPEPDAYGTYKIVMKEVSVYQEGGGIFDFAKADWNKIKLLNVGEAPPSDYVKPMINPREELLEVIKEMQKTDPIKAQDLADSFVTSVSEEGVPQSMADDFLKPRLTKRIYDSTVGRIKRVFSNLKEKFYLGELTPETGPEVFNTKIKPLYDLTTGADEAVDIMLPDGTWKTIYVGKNLRDNVIKEIIDTEDLAITQRFKLVAEKFGISVDIDITPEQSLEVLYKMWEEDGGGLWVNHESFLTNTVTVMRDNILKQGFDPPEEFVGDYGGFLISKVKEIPNFEKNFEPLETQIKILGQEFHSVYVDLIDEGYAGDLLEKELGYRVGKRHFRWFSIEYAKVLNGVYDSQPEIKNIITRELGVLVGAFKKDPSTLPISLGKKYIVRKLKKAVFLDGRAFTSPTSWWFKGQFLYGLTEGCMGNSMCIYTHGTLQESPFYMNETVQDYFVRIWRPVEPWQQYAGWQAAMMHVPPHPRFYVVSPCFAMAKIWKTDKIVEGEKTIVVYPMKVDMGDKASNYCYADENLINTYTAIWAAADVGTVIEIIVTMGVSSGKIAASQAIKGALDKWSVFDPITFTQIMAEAAISWPGYPYLDLTYDIMESEAGKVAFGELEEALKTELEE